jgi:hypothetical protein
VDRWWWNAPVLLRPLQTALHQGFFEIEEIGSLVVLERKP